MIILWVSRHLPVQEQRDELFKLFGSHQLVIDTSPFTSAQDVWSRMKRVGATDIVLVAPLSVCKALIDLGIRPIWSQMKKVDRTTSGAIEAEGTNPNGSKRHYKFIRFRRLEDIEMKFTEIPYLTLDKK